MRKNNQIKFSIIALIVFFISQLTGLGISRAEELPTPCPEPRFTKQAPSEYYSLKNPLDSTIKNLKKGKLLYQIKAKPMACKHCHSINGNGKGPLAKGIDPPPRNFTCEETINGVPDGQLFWIIKNGSPETEMFAYKRLTNNEIWQIILYIRELAQK